MSDRIFIISGLGNFDTSPSGVLKVVGGRVILDRVKAFNRARRFLNSGVNMFRILRRGIWSTALPFDWEDEGYWPLLREYVAILHQPYQEGSGLGIGPGSGADILVEIFDGCSESWMYNPHQYPVAETLIRQMFENLGGLSYVRFGVGNECGGAEARAWVRDCVYPEFKRNGRVPFSYGASYVRQNPPGSPGPLEWQKYEAEAAWDEPAALSIYRQVHGVKDKDSKNLTDTVGFWAAQGNPICVLWSVDGVWDGLNPCDFTIYNGMTQTRPSVEQLKSAMKYWLDIAWRFTLPSGQVKYGFEHIPKAVNNDLCTALSFEAISECYADKFDAMPDNHGGYPDDWVEPEPPEPPIPPETPVPLHPWLKDNWGWVAVAVIVAALMLVLL